MAMKIILKQKSQINNKTFNAKSQKMDKNKNEVVVGLDIGTTKICCIVGRRTEFGKIEILGMGKSESLGVKRGAVQNIEQAVQSIRAAVLEAETNSNVIINRVVVGIAGQHIKSIQHRGIRMRDSIEGEITQADVNALIDDMYKLVMQPGEEIIHVIPQEYIVDNEPGIKDPIGMAGRRLEANFHIVTGQISAIQNIAKCINRVKNAPNKPLVMESLILEPLASADAVLNSDEKEAGVVLVDIGGGTTDIAIFQDEILRHTAVIPFGGEVITTDISEGCSVLKKYAELLKVKFGSSMASMTNENAAVVIDGIRGREKREIKVKNLAHIIEARMEEILNHVYYEIRNSGYESKLICGIVLTGGGSNLQHIRPLTELVTGLDTRIGQPNEHLSKGASEELASPLFATAVGLLMKGIMNAEKRAALNPVLEVESELKPEIIADPIIPEITSKDKEDDANNKAVRQHSERKTADWLKSLTGGLTDKITNWLDEE
jgi:cell division protein FtsA